jgi:uncharacterized membrane protein YphA (DoxX/SURF4 family)
LNPAGIESMPSRHFPTQANQARLRPIESQSRERKMRRFMPVALTLYIAFVFIQSLFFKFTDSPETQYIFGTLDLWGASLGWPGLFAHDGIFSQYVVGTGELIASALVLAGLIERLRILRPIGALMAMGVISGAIFFHLFTPLGVSVLDPFVRLPRP